MLARSGLTRRTPWTPKSAGAVPAYTQNTLDTACRWREAGLHLKHLGHNTNNTLNAWMVLAGSRPTPQTPWTPGWCRRAAGLHKTPRTPGRCWSGAGLHTKHLGHLGCGGKPAHTQNTLDNHGVLDGAGERPAYLHTKHLGHLGVLAVAPLRNPPVRALLWPSVGAQLRRPTCARGRRD